MVKTDKDYIKVIWIQNDDKSPVILYSELDKERWETRKIEIFADGSAGYANKDLEVGGTILSLTELPSNIDIQSRNEFELYEITVEEFERVWDKVTAQ